MKGFWSFILGGGLALLLLSGTAQAVPAPPFPIQIENDDGSYVWGYMFGDEFLSWHEDMNGYTMAFERATGSWHYAQLGTDGRLQATIYRVGSVEPEALGLKKHLAPSPEVKAETVALRNRFAFTPHEGRSRLSGTLKNLVLLVKFSNHSTTVTTSQFETVFNGSSDSFKDFYDEVSYGQLNMESVIVGWLTLPYNDEYYAWNSQYQGGDPQKMVEHAVNILDNQNFDFSSVDGNNDGYVDAISVIHSGEGYETSGNWRHIHSHYSGLYYGITTHDGKHINAYHTEPEVQSDGYSPTQIGVICHETGHFFGLPDLYDYDYDSGGIGLWGLMAAGSWGGPGLDGSSPSHPSAWAKYQLDFTNPQYIQANTNGITLPSAHGSSDAVYIDEGMPYRQYFILENRQKQGYDAYLPGSGLMIYHVDDNVDNNNNQSHYLVDVEQADGQRELNNSYQEMGDNADPWPYSSNTAFTNTSTPNSRAYSASSSDISVLNITRSGSNVVFDVNLNGATGSYLSLSPGTVSFSGAVGGSNPSTQLVSVSHQGTSALSFSATSLSGWVQVSPSSGSTTSSVSIAVDTSGLSAGNHTGSVRFTSPSALNSPQTLTVNLQLADGPPVFGLNPSTMYFSGEAGASNPPSQDVTITNEGGSTLSWSAESDATWLWLSSYSGWAPATLTITANTAGLAAGQHHASVHLTAPGASERWIDVTLTLTQRGNLVVSPGSLTFSTPIGYNSPTQFLSINSDNGGVMDFGVACEPNWLRCIPSTGNTPAQISVSANTAGLAQGQYSGSITISSASADNGPFNVPVQLNIAPANSAPLAPTPISPANQAEINDTNPELTIQNAVDADGDALSYDFEIYPAQSDQVYYSTSGEMEGIGFTSWRVLKTLDFKATYRWRARAMDSKGAVGPWTDFVLFSVLPSSKKTGCSTTGGGDMMALLVMGLGLLFIRRRNVGA